MTKSFPIHSHDAKHLPLTSVPWDFLEPHREQIERNHSQTLERLAERGGLALEEMYYGIRGERLRFGSDSRRNPRAGEIVLAELVCFIMKAVVAPEAETPGGD